MSRFGWARDAPMCLWRTKICKGGIAFHMNESFSNSTTNPAHVYRCEFCGKQHPDLLSYAKCVNACSVKAEQEAKEAERKRLEEEQAARIAQIRAARDYLDQLCQDYRKDYNNDIRLTLNITPWFKYWFD